jgi:hypothetical protein
MVISEHMESEESVIDIDDANSKILLDFEDIKKKELEEEQKK